MNNSACAHIKNLYQAFIISLLIRQNVQYKDHIYIYKIKSKCTIDSSRGQIIEEMDMYH